MPNSCLFSACDVYLDIVAVDDLEIFTLQDLVVAVAVLRRRVLMVTAAKTVTSRECYNK